MITANGKITKYRKLGGTEQWWILTRCTEIVKILHRSKTAFSKTWQIAWWCKTLSLWRPWKKWPPNLSWLVAEQSYPWQPTTWQKVKRSTTDWQLNNMNFWRIWDAVYWKPSLWLSVKYPWTYVHQRQSVSFISHGTCALQLCVPQILSGPN